MIYFTSDLHYGHTNIVGKEVSQWKSGYRTFGSVEEMNSVIIGELNDKVKEDDVLYFLGDLTFKGKGTISYIRGLINCKTIHFILGNHDKEKKVRDSNCFTSVQQVLRTNIEGQEFFISHYAHRVWPGMYRNTYHIYGHCHSHLEDEAWGLSMDVGIDNYYRLFGYYRPFSFSEVSSIMKTRKELQKHQKYGLD